MDVGTPSNFSRLIDLYRDNPQDLVADVAGYSFTDQETMAAMKSMFIKGYVADPHGAVGFLGLKKYLIDNPENVAGVFLETAHPAKFHSTVERVIHQAPEFPERLKAFLGAKKTTTTMSNNYPDFRKLLLSFK
jgi:threonine synthase